MTNAPHTGGALTTTAGQVVVTESVPDTADRTPQAAPFQLFDPLPPEQYEALRADIAKRGVMVPIEVDEDGNILDGHHRSQICAELGIDCPTVVRAGLDEQAKREHVLKLNLLRRQLGPVAWADAFRQLAEMRGVQLGQGKRNDRTSATVAEVAAEVGIAARTARRRLLEVEKLTEHRDLVAAVDSGTMEVKRALRVVRERDAQERHRQRAAEFAELSKQRERAGIERVYDLWTSPRQWLLKEAERVTAGIARPTESDLKWFRLALPSTSGLAHTTASGTVHRTTVQLIPHEIHSDSAAMAAVDNTRDAVDRLRSESEARYVALHEWIAEQSRGTVAALREAAKAASDEPTVLVGRQYQRVTKGADEGGTEHEHMGMFTLQDVRNSGVRQWRTPHDPDDCACGDAAPLGCVPRIKGAPGQRCCPAVVELDGDSP